MEAQPISVIRVPPWAASERASSSQRTDDSGLDGSSLPLTTVKPVAIPRWVTGMPA